jgi:hypothetical protein
MRRLRRYPPSFLVRHPIAATRNLIGNRPSPLANRYLDNLTGVEIGAAAFNDFFLDTINVDYVATPSNAGVQRRYAGRTTPVDVVAPADDLPFTGDAYDFVLASHVLEHMTDPIKTLTEWIRVARHYVFLILPQPTDAANDGRPITSLQEQLHRHAAGFTHPTDMHWSVWSPDSFAELCAHLQVGVLEIQDPDDKRGNGFAVVLDAGNAETGAIKRPASSRERTRSPG